MQILQKPLALNYFDIAKFFRVTKHVCYGLIKTETNYIINIADLETAKRLSFKCHKFVATLDKHTSKIYHKHNGELIKTEDSRIGLNRPPIHPFCRSIMIDIDTN